MLKFSNTSERKPERAGDQGKLSLFHVLFMEALVSMATVGAEVGWGHFGLGGAVMGALIGMPIGGLLGGYEPYWITGVILSINKPQ